MERRGSPLWRESHGNSSFFLSSLEVILNISFFQEKNSGRDPASTGRKKGVNEQKKRGKKKGRKWLINAIIFLREHAPLLEKKNERVFCFF